MSENEQVTRRDESTPFERQTISVEQAGRILGVGRALSYALASQGVIPTLRLGRRLVVPLAQLRRLLEGEP